MMIMMYIVEQMSGRHSLRGRPHLLVHQRFLLLGAPYNFPRPKLGGISSLRQSNKPSKKDNLFIPYTMNYLNPSHIIYIRYARANSTSQPAAHCPAALPMAKVRISEENAKQKSAFFCFTCLSGSTFDVVRGTIKREQKQEKK